MNTIWDCVTCGACETQCPVMIEHIGTLQDMRRYRVLTEGDMPPTAQAVMSQLEQRGHPWRGTTLTRTTWMEGLDVECRSSTATQEYLYWVGCSGALVERNVPITRAVARLLTEAGVSCGCLGEAETVHRRPGAPHGQRVPGADADAGDAREPQGARACRRSSPTARTASTSLRNEYPQFGGEFEVYHHTQLLADLVEAGS